MCPSMQLVQHVCRGFLWQNSGFLKRWQKKWYSLERNQMSCCETPQVRAVLHARMHSIKQGRDFFCESACMQIPTPFRLPIPSPSHVPLQPSTLEICLLQAAIAGRGIEWSAAVTKASPIEPSNQTMGGKPLYSFKVRISRYTHTHMQSLPCHLTYLPSHPPTTSLASPSTDQIVKADGTVDALYTEAHEVRDRWLRALNDTARVQAGGRPIQLADRFQMDFSKPLGSGLFAVVLRVRDKLTGDGYALKVGCRGWVGCWG
jgi:hypothetical protein